MRLFLAYGYGDRAFADRLAGLLANKGFETFLDRQRVVAGEEFEKTVFDALQAADRVIFIVPAREGDGKNALAELGAARVLGKNIVAVMPDASRAWNAEVARKVSRSAVIDASRIDETRLVDALVA